jgi:hypothetical protein
MPDTLRMTPPEDTARAKLKRAVGKLGDDEVRVLARIAELLHLCAHVYGPLHFFGDPRSPRGKEARDELEDAMVQIACAWLEVETRAVPR